MFTSSFYMLWTVHNHIIRFLSKGCFLWNIPSHQKIPISEKFPSPKNTGIKFPKLWKIPNPRDKNPQSSGWKSPNIKKSFNFENSKISKIPNSIDKYPQISWDFLLGIFHLGSKSPIFLPGTSNPRGFLDLAQNEKSHPGDWGSRAKATSDVYVRSYGWFSWANFAYEWHTI